MREIKQSTAANIMVFMADSTDHVTGKTGLTLTVTLSKDGGSFASISPTVTEVGNGWYSIALSATDTNTIGDLVVRATATGADPAERVLNVVANVEADTYGIVNTNLDAAVSSRSTFDPATDQVTVSANNDKTGYSLVTTERVKLDATQPDYAPAVAGDQMALTSAAESSLVSAVWGATTRTLTSFGTLVSDIWGYSTRTLTAFSTSLAQTVWDVLESAITTANSIGVKLKTNLDATVSSRATQTSVNAIPINPLLTTDARLDNLDAAISSRAAPSDILVDPATDKIDGSLIDASVSSRSTFDATTDSVIVGANNDKTGYELSAAAVDAILDEVVEGTFTMRQMLRIIFSMMAGKCSGGGTATISFRDSGDTKNRIVMTVDSNGNRTSITLDGS